VYLEKEEDKLEMILSFFSKLKEIGITSLENSVLWEGLNRACAKEGTAHTVPSLVDFQKLYRTLLETEERAKVFNRGLSQVDKEDKKDCIGHRAEKERGKRR
jgi:hypothetical protein